MLEIVIIHLKFYLVWHLEEVWYLSELILLNAITRERKYVSGKQMKTIIDYWHYDTLLLSVLALTWVDEGVEGKREEWLFWSSGWGTGSNTFI